MQEYSYIVIAKTGYYEDETIRYLASYISEKDAQDHMEVATKARNEWKDLLKKADGQALKNVFNHVDPEMHESTAYSYIKVPHFMDTSHIQINSSQS